MNQRQKRQLFIEIGRAIGENLFCGKAPPLDDETYIKQAVSAYENLHTDELRVIAARAAAAVVLHRLTPEECQPLICLVVDGLVTVDEGRAAEIFKPRRSGSIIGTEPFHREARLNLAERFAKCCAYAEGVLDQHTMRVSDDAALALVVGFDRRGYFAPDIMRPLINLAGRSWQTARRLRDEGRGFTPKRELKRFLVAGRDDIHRPDIHAFLEDCRRRFANKKLAEDEFFLANVPKRKTLKHKH